jgi:arginyl-tRNA synthetase
VKPAIDILEEKISAAMATAIERSDCAAILRPSTDPRFGDYQANGVMALAKEIRTNPRKLAEEVVKNLDVSDICEQPEVAGPGFINLRLKTDFIVNSLLEINSDSVNRLSIEKESIPKTIVVDFSCPNIAKPMHVGHLRSTIIGDCICRILEFLGHKVIRQNHIGDWGLQMGMVIYAMRNFGLEEESDEWLEERLCDDEIKFLRDFYRNLIECSSNEKYSEIREQFASKLADLEDKHLDLLEERYKRTIQLEKEDPQVADEVRKWTFALQNGDPVANFFYEKARETTLRACFDIYHMLRIYFKDEEIRGESFYKDMLAGIVQGLEDKGIAEKSDFAVCVFPEGFKNKEGQPLPFIIQKSDGAYLYATTDLAAIRYRINELKADKIVYVTDSRQKLHFEMLFAVARMAGWVGDDVELSHVMFGSVLGEDGTPLKTRSGENVKLKELLDEAVERARAVVDEKNPELGEEKKAEIAKAVGIGAVKYADYSNNRTSDYVFSFDKMLAMDGNTAPYMQYAYARIKSIERKAQIKDVDVETELRGLEEIYLTEPAELDLAKYLIRYGEAIEAAVSDYRPNYLTSYLYELAQKFSVFYTNCPVLDAGLEKRPTRLLLCDLTAKVIKHGLNELLGIEVVEQM